MGKFFVGSAMGLMMGAGIMMMPGARKFQRTMTKEAAAAENVTSWPGAWGRPCAPGR